MVLACWFYGGSAISSHGFLLSCFHVSFGNYKNACHVVEIVWWALLCVWKCGAYIKMYFVGFLMQSVNFPWIVGLKVDIGP